MRLNHLFLFCQQKPKTKQEKKKTYQASFHILKDRRGFAVILFITLLLNKATSKICLDSQNNTSTFK